MEAAFVLPVLLLVVFGIIEFGQVFQKSLTMSEATRAGARLGVAQPRQAGYDDDVAVAVRETLRAGVGNAAIEFLAIYKADPATGEPIDGTEPEWPATSQSACGGLTDTDYLGIYLRARHDMSTSFLPGTLTLTERTVMRRRGRLRC